MKHPVDVSIELVVPEPEHGEAFTAQDDVTDIVMPRLLVLGMPPAIEFYNQPSAETDEIEEVAAKRRLPPEVEAVGPHPFQAHP
jgi:hypothetical protein